MSIPAPSAGATIRDVLAAHESNPSCGGCHVLIDPIGLAFEKYDGIGAYRNSWAADGSQPIDAQGEIIGGGDLSGKFDGALELARKLASSRTAADCLANQWFRFALGRMESSDDACSMQAIHDGFAASACAPGTCVPGGRFARAVLRCATSFPWFGWRRRPSSANWYIAR